MQKGDPTVQSVGSLRESSAKGSPRQIVVLLKSSEQEVRPASHHTARGTNRLQMSSEGGGITFSATRRRSADSVPPQQQQATAPPLSVAGTSLDMAALENIRQISARLSERPADVSSEYEREGTSTSLQNLVAVNVNVQQSDPARLQTLLQFLVGSVRALTAGLQACTYALSLPPPSRFFPLPPALAPAFGALQNWAV